MSHISANHATLTCDVFVFRLRSFVVLIMVERQFAEQNFIKMKNDFHLEAAALTQLQPILLNSEKNSISAHENQCFGYFCVEQKSIL